MVSRDKISLKVTFAVSLILFASARSEALAADGVARALIPPLPVANERVISPVAWPPTRYAATSLHCRGVVGMLTVDVQDGGLMTLEASGTADRLGKITIYTQDNTLFISSSASQRSETNSGELAIRIAVPRGSPVNIESFVGDAKIGDTAATLTFDALSGHSEIGKVISATISLGGTADLTIAEVTEKLDLRVAGLAKAAVGPTDTVRATIEGNGSVQLGAVASGVSLRAVGSGHVSVASVNGPTDVTLVGSGSVSVSNGTARPLHVNITGAGSFDFGGNAVDPTIEGVGSGKVSLKSYTGQIKKNGMIKLKLGQ